MSFIRKIRKNKVKNHFSSLFPIAASGMKHHHHHHGHCNCAECNHDHHHEEEEEVVELDDTKNSSTTV